MGKPLGRLQNCLGSLHDLTVAEGPHDSLFAELEPITGARLAAQLAELLENHGPSRKQLLRNAAKALAEVENAPAWWKGETAEAAAIA
jgi:hypothetical protein